MPRTARIVVPRVAHHVTQRGNNRQDVFFTTDDRRTCLGLLQTRCDAAGVRVLGDCLMTNHVHLVLVPTDEVGLAHAVGRTHFAYAPYVNRLHGRSGHLWQGRLYSSPLDQTHLRRALAYIQRDPVRARRVRRTWCWPWSRAAEHVGQEQDRCELLDLAPWRAAWSPARWPMQLTQPADKAWTRRFWRAAHTGRPPASSRVRGAAAMVFCCRWPRLPGMMEFVER